jgi:hypothetical protein
MALRMSKRLQKEYESIQKNNQDMKVLLPNNDLALWHVNFQGAKGTLYEGETFTLQLRFSNDYVRHSAPSPSIHPKSSSSATSPFTSTSTPMVSSASQSSTTVWLRLIRVVARPDCLLHLPVSAVDAEQRSEEDQASK